MDSSIFKFLAGALCIVALACPSTTLASVEVNAFSLLDINDFGIYITPSGGAERPLDVSDFTSITPGLNSSASAVLTPGGGDATLNPTGLDTVQALVGNAVPPTFGPTVGFEPFSRGDTRGTGAIIAGFPATPFGADVTTVAETQLDSILALAGSSESKVGTTASFTFTTVTPLALTARLMAELMLNAELDVPDGFNAQATSAFSITLVGSGSFLQWSPNGTGTVLALGGVTGTVIADPFSLNQSVARLASDGTGSTSFASGPSIFELDLSVPAGTYSLSINHQSTAFGNRLPVCRNRAVFWCGDCLRRRFLLRV